MRDQNYIKKSRSRQSKQEGCSAGGRWHGEASGPEIRSYSPVDGNSLIRSC